MKNKAIPNYFIAQKRAYRLLLLLTFGFVLMLISTLHASEALSLQQPSVTGKIIDMYSGEPLVGVTIQIKGTDTGVRSQKDGSYTINITGDSKTLVFAASGYQTLQIDIDGRAKIDVAMSKGNSAEESELWD